MLQAKDKLVLFLRREVEKRRKRPKKSVISTEECPIDIDAVFREEFGALLGDDAIVASREESLLSRYLRSVGCLLLFGGVMRSRGNEFGDKKMYFTTCLWNPRLMWKVMGHNNICY